MTRRAVFSSKSNTAARGIEFQHASQNVGKIDDKNEDSSKSVSSFHFGPIFPDALGQDLFRNVGGMSSYGGRGKFKKTRRCVFLVKRMELLQMRVLRRRLLWVCHVSLSGLATFKLD